MRLVIRCSVQASHFTHASASRSGEMHHGGQSARRVSKVAKLTDLCEMAIRRAFFRSRCQRGTAVFAVACPFCGTQEKCGARQNLDDARRWMARGFTEFPAREIPEDVSGSRVRRIHLSSLRVGIHDLICNTHRARGDTARGWVCEPRAGFAFLPKLPAPTLCRSRKRIELRIDRLEVELQ